MTADSVALVPNQPKTPPRSFRVSDDLWQRAKAHAADLGITVTDVLVRALEDFVAEPPPAASRVDVSTR